MLLDQNNILKAFAALGTAIRSERDIEILIVGGSALMLTGQLSPGRTTDDVDLLACHLPVDRDAILDAAASVGRLLDLPAGWLNDFSGLFRWMLLENWRDRAVEIGTFNRLRVLAPGRLDLLLMKLLAHRDKDQVHLGLMKPTRIELDWAIVQMKHLHELNPNERSRIDLSIEIARSWKIHE